MPETVTQFCARVLGLLPFDPPAPKRYGASSYCWLCGGETLGIGWSQETAIAPTFTQHNTAKRHDSDAVCQGCAALTKAETYQAMIKRLGLPIKIWTQCGWHSYSHYIREDGHYEAPVPSRMREILLDPPSGHWLLTVNSSGQKHTIFRGTIATSRDYFPVQVDEETVWIAHANFLAALAAWEHLAALGCGKAGIETGRYHPADTMRAGLAAWRPAEAAMAPWRAFPGLVTIVRHVARSAKTIADAGEAITRDSITPTPQQPEQGSLF